MTSSVTSPRRGSVRSPLSVLATLAAVFAVLLTWIGPLEAPASATLDSAMKKAFITFATARALNAGISLLQSGEVTVQAVGGASIRPGEVLDPLNDLVEQFSNVMLAATVALGIQKILLAMGMHWILSLLVTIAAIAWIVLPFTGRMRPRWLTRTFVFLLMVRFVVPVALLGTHALSDAFLAHEYQSSQRVLEEIGSAAEPTLESASAEAAPVGFWERLRNAVSGIGDMGERLTQLRTAAGELVERVTTLIVVFLLETMVFPLAIVGFVYLAARALLRPISARAVTLGD